MKRFTALFLAALLLLSLIACGGRDAWQEQYDLGMRYLNEGNYQEAVIAFEAAIEIDAKRPEAYLGAAEAYIGLGDYVSARRILEDGLTNTEDPEIREKLDNLDTQHPAAAVGYNPTPFTERENYQEFSSLTNAQQSLLRALMAAALLNDGTTTVDASWTEFPGEVEVYTELDGYRMRVTQYDRDEGNDRDEGPNRYREIEFEMRPESGMGYLYEMSRNDFDTGDWWGNDVRVVSGSCLCSGWLWNGEYHRYSTLIQHHSDLELTGEYWLVGMIEDGFRVGDFRYKSVVMAEHWDEESITERTDTYEKGTDAIFDWSTDWQVVLHDESNRSIADRLYW